VRSNIRRGPRWSRAALRLIALASWLLGPAGSKHLPYSPDAANGDGASDLADTSGDRADARDVGAPDVGAPEVMSDRPSESASDVPNPSDALDAHDAPDVPPDTSPDLAVDGPFGAVAAPRLIAPLSTATVTSQHPTLRWELAPNTDGARIQICRDRNCSAGNLVATFDAAGSSGAPPAG